MDYKSLVLRFLFLGVLAFSCVVGGFYLYDPFAFYGQNHFTKNKFQTDEKYGLPAMVDANWAKFDSVIVGTSMLRSSNGRDISTKDNKYANFSVDRFNISDRFTFINYLYTKKKLKNIIYSLDPEMLFVHKNDPSYKVFFGKTNIRKIYHTTSFYGSRNKFFICLLTLSSKERCVGRKLDLYMPQATTYPMAKDIKLQQNLDISHYLRYTKTFAPIRQKTNLQLKTQLNFYKEKFFSLVAKHPKTQFSVIIPPYSTLFYRLDSLILDRLALLKMIINEGEKYVNLKFYYFQDEPFVNDFTNFASGMLHYKHFVNALELKAIKNQTHLINTSNFEAKKEAFLSVLKGFDLEALRKYFVPNIPPFYTAKVKKR